MYFLKKKDSSKRLRQAFDKIKIEIESLKKEISSLKKENDELKHERIIEQNDKKQNISIPLNQEIILELLEKNIKDKILKEIKHEIKAKKQDETHQNNEENNEQKNQPIRNQEIINIEESISPSEKQILFLLLSNPEGMTLEEIGLALKKDKKTIHTQITSLKKKRIPITSLPTTYNKMIYILSEEIATKLEKLKNSAKIYNN